MLPRISSVLVKFISPITNSVQQNHADLRTELKNPNGSPNGSKEKGSGDRSRQQEEKSSRPNLQLNPQEDIQPNPQKDKKESHLKLVSSSTSSSPLLQLLTLFQKQGSPVSQREGAEAYTQSLQRSKKIGRSRKGVILDQKEEE